MNSTQIKMLNILKKLKNDYGVLSVKAEFEAEGVRSEELIWLLEIAHKSSLKTALKIGGCEAVRDLIESVTFGCDYVIAPMIESKYSLQKFILAKNKVYKEKTDTNFLFNLETKTGFNDRENMFQEAENNVNGCVFGRVDYSGSLGISRDNIENTTLTKNIHLTRFETRKIVFSSEALDLKDIEKGLSLAVEFELLWLKNKRQFYSQIYIEDENRINMLEKRSNNF